MKTPLLRLITTTIVLLTFGCASRTHFDTRTVTTAPEGKALVTLYRPGSFAGAASAFKIFANDRHITSLPNASYYPYIAEPGVVRFAKKMQVNPLNVGLASLLDPKQDLIELKVEPGRAYYVRFKLGIGKTTMERVDDTIAHKELSTLSQATPANAD